MRRRGCRRPGRRAAAALLPAAAALLVTGAALLLAPAPRADAAEVPVDSLLVTLGPGCEPGVHHQPNGPFAVLAFCEDALGDHIAVEYADRMGAPESERYGPRWRLADRLWQEERWACDVTSYAWSPDGNHLFVATSDVYGSGAVFDLDLPSRTAVEVVPGERRATAGRRWLGYVLVSLDARKGELRYGVLEVGTNGERITRVRKLRLAAQKPVPGPPAPRARPGSLADSLLDAIATRGSAAVLEDLYERAPGLYTAVCDSIGRGSVRWLEVARRIQPGTDAGTAEDLEDALSFALERHPREVLRLLGASENAPFPIAAVMGAWIHRDCPDLETARAVVERRIAAVSGVGDPALAPTRRLCLDALKRLKADLPNMFPAREP